MKKLFILIIAMGLIAGCSGKSWTISYSMGPLGVTFVDEGGQFTKEEIREMLLPYFPDPKAVKEKPVEKIPEKEEKET